MRKMTPMILVILMLASVLSSIDVYELKEQNEFEETSARSGADPEVVYVTSPRETLCIMELMQLMNCCWRAYQLQGILEEQWRR